jgi:hypothetical protein
VLVLEIRKNTLFGCTSRVHLIRRRFQDRDVLGAWPAPVLAHLEFHEVALLKGFESLTVDAGVVDENILSAVGWSEEAPPLVIRKPRNCALHVSPF